MNVQPLGLDVALDQLGQPRLVDRDLAAVEGVDLLLVDVDAGHVVAALGEAGAGDQADVTGADHGDLHNQNLKQRKDGSAAGNGRGRGAARLAGREAGRRKRTA